MIANFRPQVNPVRNSPPQRPLRRASAGEISNGVKTKLVFFGTSEFAVPALKRLAEDANCEIAAVITQPDKPAGRKQALSPSPVKVAAQELGLEIFQPEKSEISDERLAIRNIDLFIVASYGKIIPKSVLGIPKHGTLNIHPSLLPKYRGPSPIQAAILNADSETGVTIMKLDEEMDHGDVVANKKLMIDNHNNTFKTLHDELAELGAKLLMITLPDYLSGKIKSKVQDHSKATYTKIITKDDGRIDWAKSAEEIDRQIRAYHLWPVAWTTLGGKRLKIFIAAPHSPPLERGGIKGEVEIAGGQIVVHCGSGSLEILELQLEGSKKITAREFANGYKNLAKQAIFI